jgi:hypothetical protein
VECHGPEKHKGGYRLDDREALCTAAIQESAIIVSNSAAKRWCSDWCDKPR